MKNIIRFKKLRFALVGALNTLVDFAIFICLTTFGLNTVAANVASTSCGMACSFFLNRSFVFNKKNGSARRDLLKFVIVTLIGLWIIQSTIIIASGWALTEIFSLESGTTVNIISKIIATFASLLWNYLWYNKYVFKEK